MFSVDARVPLRFAVLVEARDGEAVLIEGIVAPRNRPAATFEVAVAAHPPGCACCVTRSAAALALADLFARRAKGAIEFRAVVAVTGSEAGRSEVIEALRHDPFASARFRLAH